MSKVNFYLKYPTERRPQLIYLFFSYNGKRLKFSTGEKILPSKWDFDNQKTKSDASINDFLKSLSNTVETLERNARIQGEPLSLEKLRELLNKKLERSENNTPNLLNFIKSFIEECNGIKKEGTIKGYKNTLTHLIDYKRAKNIRLDFENINLDFYNNFNKYLFEEKGFSVNTFGKQVKNLKYFLNEATERGINKYTDYKSRRFVVLSEETDNIYLNEEELEKIWKLDLDNNPKLDRVRDLFIVGCYTGLRFSDFSAINPANIKDNRITLKTAKMNKPVAIPIHKYVSRVLYAYRNENNSLPPAISNQKMNEYLKDIGKLAGLTELIEISYTKGNKRIREEYSKYELISTHTARRSFASNLYASGFPAISIMQITGHTTEKAFLKYIKITPEQHASMLEKHWQSNEVKRRAAKKTNLKSRKSKKAS